jgi:hypothetical protein
LSIFADSSDLHAGDIALILRDDGTFQLASAIPAESHDPQVGRRHVQHMLLALGLYMLATDDHRLEELVALGATDTATNLVRDAFRRH